MSCQRSRATVGTAPAARSRVHWWEGEKGQRGWCALFTPRRFSLQLTGLCPPLIPLSPEANKENLDSPLLKF